MHLKTLWDTPPWNWPSDAAETILGALLVQRFPRPEQRRRRRPPPFLTHRPMIMRGGWNGGHRARERARIEDEIVLACCVASYPSQAATTRYLPLPGRRFGPLGSEPGF